LIVVHVRLTFAMLMLMYRRYYSVRRESVMVQRPTQQGIADFLEQFEESPYTFRPNSRIEFEGKSSLKGSWQASKEPADEKTAPQA
jgi:hypothetical protein